jgi:hypothetical protein
VYVIWQNRTKRGVKMANRSLDVYDDNKVAKVKPAIMAKIKAKVKQEFAYAKDKLIKAEKDFSGAVVKHPKASVGIAAGVGAAIATAITLAIVKHKKKNKFQLWEAKVKKKVKKFLKKRRR